ncbi:unnamed protein product, partial [Meganyctiphanes norvegica]
MRQKLKNGGGGTNNFYYYTQVEGVVLTLTYYMWSYGQPVETCWWLHQHSSVDIFSKRQIIVTKLFPENGYLYKKFTNKKLLVGGVLFHYFPVGQIPQGAHKNLIFSQFDMLGALMSEAHRKYEQNGVVVFPTQMTGYGKKCIFLNTPPSAVDPEWEGLNYPIKCYAGSPVTIYVTNIAMHNQLIENREICDVYGDLRLAVFVNGPPKCTPIMRLWWAVILSFSYCANEILLNSRKDYSYNLYQKSALKIFRSTRPIIIKKIDLFSRSTHIKWLNGQNNFIQIITQMLQMLPALRQKIQSHRTWQYTRNLYRHIIIAPQNAYYSCDNENLNLYRIYVCCPTLIQEMVTCVSQLIMLAHAGRISRLPSLDTIEACMKLSPNIVQALWEAKNPLLQLPYVTDDSLRHFVTKKKPVKSIEHLVSLPATERRHVLRSLSDEEFSDTMVVCSKMPKITMSVKCEVVDDDDTGVFTAGAIVTVTVCLRRRPLGEVYDQDLENSIVPLEELQKESNKDIDSSKSGWKRPQQKKGGKSKAKPQPQKKKVVKKEEEKPEEKKTEDKLEKRDPPRNG